MNAKAIKFEAIPEYAYPSVPGKQAFFETVALLGLEGKPIRLSAADQRRVLGFPVFGKQEIIVSKNGTVTAVRSVAFGMDCEVGEYLASTIEAAANAGKKLSPGVSGPDFFSQH